MPKLNDVVTMNHIVPGDTGILFPKAIIRDQGGVALTESPVTLTHVSDGRYTGTFVMPDKKEVFSHYLIYTNAGQTVKHPTERDGGEVFELDETTSDIETKIDSVTVTEKRVITKIKQNKIKTTIKQNKIIAKVSCS